MSAWLSSKCIGMNPEGYGALLGEVTWSCSKVSSPSYSRLASVSHLPTVPNAVINLARCRMVGYVDPRG